MHAHNLSHDTRVWIDIQNIQNTMHTHMHYPYIMPLLYNISRYGLLSKPDEDPRNPLTKYCLQKIAQRKNPKLLYRLYNV
jgi:hypothetical protein